MTSNKWHCWRLHVTVGCILQLAIALNVQAESLTLQQAYQLALNQSEDLKSSVEAINIAKARYLQAYSAVLPQISLSLDERIRNSTSSGSSTDSTIGGSIPAGKRSRFRSIVGISQPLFHGFQEFLIADAAKAEVQAGEYSTQRQRQVLFLDLVTLFEQVNLQSAELAVFKRTQGVLNERTQELESWLKLGKSKGSELAAAKAETSALLADIEELTGARNAAMELLNFIVGDNFKAADLVPLKIEVPPLDLKTLIESSSQRADIKALALQVESAKKLTVASSRKQWPALSLDGNYYPYQDPSSDQDWDITLNLEMPIFTGGRLAAEVSEREAIQRQAEWQLQKLKRQSETDVKRYYSDLESSLKRQALLKKFVGNAEESYHAQKEDSKLGIVTNLDVLQSIRALDDARRSLLATAADVELNYHRLMVAVGEIKL